MIKVVQIGEKTLERYNRRVRVFSLWVLVAELTFSLAVLPLAMMNLAALAIALCLARCLVIIAWGSFLLAQAPPGGPMGDYDDIDVPGSGDELWAS